MNEESIDVRDLLADAKLVIAHIETFAEEHGHQILMRRYPLGGKATEQLNALIGISRRLERTASILEKSLPPKKPHPE